MGLFPTSRKAERPSTYAASARSSSPAGFAQLPSARRAAPRNPGGASGARSRSASIRRTPSAGSVTTHKHLERDREPQPELGRLDRRPVDRGADVVELGSIGRSRSSQPGSRPTGPVSARSRKCSACRRSVSRRPRRTLRAARGELADRLEHPVAVAPSRRTRLLSTSDWSVSRSAPRPPRRPRACSRPRRRRAARRAAAPRRRAARSSIRSSRGASAGARAGRGRRR